MVRSGLATYGVKGPIDANQHQATLAPKLS